MFERILGIVTFKSSTYQEVANDKSALGQAAEIVAVVALIQWAVNSLVLLNAFGSSNLGQYTVSVLAAIVFALIAWAVTGWLFPVIANFFGGKTNSGQILRAAGFVQAFGVLSILSLVALLGPSLALVNSLIAVVVFVLVLAGYFIVARDVAGLETWKAALTAFLALIGANIALLLLDFLTGSFLSDFLISM